MNSILIGLHSFAGPYEPAQLMNKAGICAALYLNGGKIQLLDVFQASDLRQTWEQRQELLRKRFGCAGKLTVGVIYMDQLSGRERQRVLLELKQELCMLNQAA